MIRFCCEHCGKTVAVGDAHAGARGRCSGCRQIVTIPSPTMPSRNDNVAALAAALRGDSGDSGVLSPPPPPPSKTHNTDTDEFDLVDLHASSAFETDTYPAIRDNSANDGDADRRAEAPTAPLPNSKPLSRAAMIVVAVLAAAMVAAIAYLLRGHIT